VIPSFIDAVADPALRPKMIAAMQKLDPKIARQTDLVSPYLQLGQVDVAFQVLQAAAGGKENGLMRYWDLKHVWSPEGRALRTDPRFAALAAQMGLVDYWKQYGYPDGCRAGTDAPIVCS
jgi:hypothetical protein